MKSERIKEGENDANRFLNLLFLKEFVCSPNT
jgi:hypothetical protein